MDVYNLGNVASTNERCQRCIACFNIIGVRGPRELPALVLALQ